MSRNSELIERIKNVSIELPLLQGDYNKAVDDEIARPKSKKKGLSAIEPAFNAMRDYRHALADELIGRGPACTKLAIALRGGFDIPEPYAFIFDAIAELESVKEIDTGGSVSTSEFRDDLQPLADFIDSNTGSISQLAKAYRDSLIGKKRKPVETYMQSISYIRRVRRKRSQSETH
jgi:hypothetical protein